MAKKALPFLISALIWGVVGAIFSARESTDAYFAVSCFGQYWALCLIDLWATAQVLIAIGRHLGYPGKQGNFLLIRALYWGTIKLACLGVFITSLKKAGSEPIWAVLLGTGTLFIIPLVGGIYRHRRDRPNGKDGLSPVTGLRILKHA